MICGTEISSLSVLFRRTPILKQKNQAKVNRVGIVLYECDFSQAIFFFFLTSMGGSDLTVEGRTEKGSLGKLGSNKKKALGSKAEVLNLIQLGMTVNRDSNRDKKWALTAGVRGESWGRVCNPGGFPFHI